MPANLPAEAKAKWIKVMEARTPEEKLKALQEFLSCVPKHKGTEKLISRIRRQMALLRREIEERRRKKHSTYSPFSIPREGNLQLVLIGMPNSGKSLLLRRLTNAKPKVSPIPFSTNIPVPGMFIYKGVLIQIIEVPSFFLLSSKGSLASQSLALIRNSDGILMVLDASEDPLEQFNRITKALEGAHINIVRSSCLIEIKRTREGGIRIFGKLRGCTHNDVIKLLNSYRIFNAVVHIWGEATLDDIENSIFESYVYKPTIVLVNKVEDKSAHYKAIKVKDLLEEKVPTLLISAKSGSGLDPEKLGSLILKTLDVIRVYTKEPGSPPSPKPLVLPRGARVIDVARRIHSHFEKYFKYAKVWSEYLPYSPQRVGADFELHDGDIIEIRV